MIRSSLENAGGKVQNRLPFANRGKSAHSREHTRDLCAENDALSFDAEIHGHRKESIFAEFFQEGELTELFFLLAPNIRERILQRNQLECAVLAFGVCANQISKYHP